MSKKPKRDARWNAVYGARFAQLYAERARDWKLTLAQCVKDAEICADLELSLRAGAVPNPAEEQQARRKKVAK